MVPQLIIVADLGNKNVVFIDIIISNICNGIVARNHSVIILYWLQPSLKAGLD